MQSIAATKRRYRRLRVGLDDNYRYFICSEAVIMRHPESTLARCLIVCREEDGRKKDDYIEIPHEGRHFKEILKHMAGDSKPLMISLKQSPASVMEELKYHGLDTFKFDNVARRVKRCKNYPAIDVLHSIDHLQETIEFTDEPMILILNYVNDRKSEEAKVHLERVKDYSQIMMDRLEVGSCRLISFEGDLLQVGEEKWTPSALVLGWREQPKHGIQSDKWYHNFAHRECLVERRVLGEGDLTGVIDELESYQQQL